MVPTSRRAFRGHDGLRRLANMLQVKIPHAECSHVNRLVEGRFALPEWTVDCGAVAVEDGADSFVVENGEVVAQIIRYKLSVRDSKARAVRSAS